MTAVDTLPPLRREYSHRSVLDLHDLRADVAGLSIEQKALASIACVRQSLMVGALPLRIGIKVACIRHGDVTGPIVYASMLSRKAPEVIEDLWNKTLRHMAHGKDSFDRMSAGGWNKQELDRFLRILETVGWQRSLLPEPVELEAHAPGPR